MAAPRLVRTGPAPGPSDKWEEPAHGRLSAVPKRAAVPGRTAGNGSQALAERANRTNLRSWPLVLLALPAAVAVWSGWVGIGRLTGFGQVHPLPGIWDSLHIDTAITLPVGIEAYAAYALRAWLATGVVASVRTRRFAKWSATGSLLLGMAGQVAYHLLTQAGATRAPWEVTVVVACLPVLILGMAAGLSHLIRADAADTTIRGGLGGGREAGQRTEAADCLSPERVAAAEAAAAELTAAGRRVSRRNLRAAGVHGSNADLGALARVVGVQFTSGRPANGPADGLPARIGIVRDLTRVAHGGGSVDQSTPGGPVHTAKPAPTSGLR